MRRKKSTTKKLISRLLALLIIATLSLFGLTYRQEIKNFAKGFLPVAVQKNKAKTSQSQNTSKEKKATVDKEKQLGLNKQSKLRYLSSCIMPYMLWDLRRLQMLT